MDVMSKLLKTSLIVAAFVPSLALAQAVGGDKELSLSGTGSSDKDFDNTIFSLDVAFGHYLTDTAEIGVRQNVNVNDREGDDTSFSGATRFFYDQHFGDGQMRPFVGVSLGGIYGEDVDDTFSGGPEVGLKYYVLEKTFVQGMVEYQFLFKSASDVDNRFDDGAFFYSVGMGYNF